MTVEKDYATARQAYYDNASYFADDDSAKAKLFVTACIQLIGILPKRSTHTNAQDIEFDVLSLQRERQAAMAWLNSRSDATGKSTGGSIHFDLSDYRA